MFWYHLSIQLCAESPLRKRISCQKTMPCRTTLRIPTRSPRRDLCSRRSWLKSETMSSGGTDRHTRCRHSICDGKARDQPFKSPRSLDPEFDPHNPTLPLPAPACAQNTVFICSTPRRLVHDLGRREEQEEQEDRARLDSGCRRADLRHVTVVEGCDAV